MFFEWDMDMQDTPRTGTLGPVVHIKIVGMAIDVNITQKFLEIRRLAKPSSFPSNPHDRKKQKKAVLMFPTIDIGNKKKE